MGNNWYKLDNAAKIYPAAQTSRWAPIFRLSATLNEDVDVEVLNEALVRVLRRMPTMACRLKAGLFWYRLESVEGVPTIEVDVRNPMLRIDSRKSGGFLFRVRCYHCRIAVEFFHAVSDGTGGLTFLLTMVREYLRLRYGADIPTGERILDCSADPSPDEMEDAFLRHASDESISRKEPLAYTLQGTHIPREEVILTSGTAPTDRLLALARQHNATLGELLTALLIQAIAEVQRGDRSKVRRRRQVKVSVPVNLRPYFNSKSLRNFSSYINVGIDTRLGEHTLDEIISQTHHTMKLGLTEKQLRGRFSGNVALEKTLVIRMLPLVLKNPIMRSIYNYEGKRYISSTLTNIGLVNLPEEMQHYVERLDFLLGPSTSAITQMATISYNNQTSLNFTRTMAESDVERCFFRSLVRMGVPVRVESNRRN